MLRDSRKHIFQVCHGILQVLGIASWHLELQLLDKIWEFFEYTLIPFPTNEMCQKIELGSIKLQRKEREDYLRGGDASIARTYSEPISIFIN